MPVISSSYIQKIRLLPGSAVISTGMIFLIAGIIIAAVWLAIEAAYENVRFAQSSDQLLSLIALVRDDAKNDKNFGLQPGEDLLATLWRRGQITGGNDDQPPPLINAWQGAIHMQLAEPLVARLETSLPGRDCRRLALLIGNDAADLALQKMEARSAGVWQSVYDINAKSNPAAAITAACGTADQVMLALTIRLR